MKKNKFNNMDLNLLRTLLVLSQELNTRKAAERLFVSQPAISQALQKLRHHLGDELFVKAPNGLKPTPFTQEFIEEVTPSLDAISNSLNKIRKFDPLTLNGKIKIAVAPAVLSCLSGSLYIHFSKVAPNCIIELSAWKSESLQDIQSEESIIGISFEQQLIQSVLAESIAEFDGKIVVRKDHPLHTETVIAKELQAYPIASVVTPGYNDNFTEAAVLMEKEGVNATVGFRSEFVMAVVDVLEHTDFFMPHSELFPIHRYPELKMLTPLIGGKPYTGSLSVYYHAKQQQTEFMSWLIEQVTYIVNEGINKNRANNNTSE